MKKFIVFLIIVLLLCGVRVTYIEKLSFDDLFAGASVEVYLPNKFDTEYETISNGEGMVVCCSVLNLAEIIDTYNINGFTIRLKGVGVDEVVSLLCPNYVFKSCEWVYGYLNYYNDFVVVCDRPVNFQCAKSEDGVCLGFPILLGSY